MQVLVLNASYEVLNVTRWQRAVCLIFSGKAELLEVGSAQLRSPTTTMPVPSVIRMVYHVRKPRMRVPFSRGNIFMRDRNTCQYCGCRKAPSELTLDHIVPRSRGGETSWENVITACRRCNIRKGDRSPEEVDLKLRKKPRIPHYIPTLNSGYHEEWAKYVPYLTPAVCVPEEVH